MAGAGLGERCSLGRIAGKQGTVGQRDVERLDIAAEPINLGFDAP